MNELPEPIAIIGLAGRFPGARSADEFWRNLMAGTDSVESLDDDTLRANGVTEAALTDPGYVKVVAQAADLDRFDAGFFGFTPRDAEISDPQIRLFLETAHAALENAGHVPGSLPDVGVFGSVGTNTYQGRLADTDGGRARSTTGMSRGALNNADSAATLVSYKLGLHGPSMTVQTACSSSLVAVHLAAQSLRAGECELALAGGADVELPSVTATTGPRADRSPRTDAAVRSTPTPPGPSSAAVPEWWSCAGSPTRWPTATTSWRCCVPLPSTTTAPTRSATPRPA